MNYRESMAPKNFLFCIPLKYGAWIMAFINLVFGVTSICGAATELFDYPSREDALNLGMCIIIGVFNILIGVLLLAAILMAKEKYVLLYLMFEMANLIMVTIFAVFNMFQYKSLFLLALFIISIILWYGLYCMCGYYVELAEYNSVKSGVIEISYNAQINPVMMLPEKAIESTAV